ncbi:MAG TPA: AAA family ATPase, partial [Kofleriaceae bacterium]|nr:AAA family ATPase [Kofleriaceae bacterium]
LLDSGAIAEPLVASIGANIAGALAAVHARGLIHRDVKPANIFVEPGDRAKLIDFGFVAKAGERGVRADGSFVGTLRYSAPEQAGGAKRPIDARSDLYALGVVLFEAATGAVPFAENDAAELLRQHATEPPPKARTLNPKISPVLEAILDKLLAKEPADRYQSAAGLAADLARLGALNERLAAGEPIALDKGAGQSMAAPRPTPLLGRAAELAQISEQWKRAVRREGSVLLVRGEAGMGKSRLLDAAQTACGLGAIALRGDCARGDTPYAPLRAALDQYLAQLGPDNTAPASIGDELRGHVLATCDRYAPFLAAISERIAARHPPTTSLADLDQDQLRTLFADFLLELCGGPAPMLLCLDDVHLLDEGSGDVLRRFALGLSEARCLVLAAGRAETDAETGAPSMLEVLERDLAPALSPQLTLGGLDEEAIAQLVSSLLGGAPIDRAFIRHVAARTGGNPLVIAEYVSAVFEAGLLLPAWDRWVTDEGGLDLVQLPTDVSALTQQRVARLSEATRDVLRTAAVLGLRFEAADVARARGEPLEQVAAALGAAVQTQIATMRAGGQLQFVHAGFVSAMLADLRPEELATLHQAVAESLDAAGAATGRPMGSRGVYALARHYGQGIRTKNPRRVFEVSLAAGKRALADASQEAEGFLKQAELLASEAGLPPQVELLEVLGEVCLRRNETEEAVRYFRVAIEAAATSIKRAQLRERLARVFVSHYGAAKARPELEAALQELEWSHPIVERGAHPDLHSAPHPAPPPTSRQPEGEELDRLKTIADAYDCMTIMEGLAANRELAMERAKQGLTVALQIGKSPQLVRACMSYAFVSGFAQERAVVEEYGRHGVEVAEEIGDRSLVAKSTLYYATGQAFAGAEQECERRLVANYEQNGRWLDADGFNMTC